jgi:hypothetical protein
VEETQTLAWRPIRVNLGEWPDAARGHQALNPIVECRPDPTLTPWLAEIDPPMWTTEWIGCPISFPIIVTARARTAAPG